MEHTHRLAELVFHLTGCTPRAAVAAVDAATDSSPSSIEPLAIVAKAMCSVHRVDLTEQVDLRETINALSQ